MIGTFHFRKKPPIKKWEVFGVAVICQTILSAFFPKKLIYSACGSESAWTAVLERQFPLK